ncbi:hypothetical protein [Vibrio sp. SCSIO 43137]|uniref:hypothetical protein n=1 Tax=Vibrio sp. SCSIO 43137 TaxID=3021011 RepID=UPI002307C27F|nr:hypothetical protein [Vibrio sp. SCSIO 43137]WCE29967.1 hypothetical protein PK654_01250 [Vibrio sp. SCSIO 43137]
MASNPATGETASNTPWYEGITDSVGGFFGDALDFSKGVYDNVTANKQADVERVTNENATRTEQARVQLQTDQLNYQREKDAENRKLMMVGGGIVLVLIILALLFKGK